MAEVYWRDVDASFDQNGQGKLLVKTNASSLKQRIRNVLRLEPGDIPFHPEIYCGLLSLSFENFYADVKIQAEENIRNVLRSQEPTIEVISIDVVFSEDDHGFIVVGTFKEEFSDEIVPFKTIIGRVR